MALALSYLPNTSIPLLVSAGTDHKVHLYIKTNSEFRHILSLQGHTDWVRSIDVANFTDTFNNKNILPGFNHGDLMIATASQDKYIRIWKLSDVVSNGDANIEKDEHIDNNDKHEFDNAVDMLQALIGEDGLELNLCEF